MKSSNGIFTNRFGGLLATMVAGLILASAAQAQIYITSETGNSVGKYNLDGTPINSSLITGLNGPAGIAVSGSDVFVANSGSGTIGEYTTSGGVVNSSLISGLNGPEFLAVSGSDLYVTNVTSGTVGEYTLGATPGTIASSTPALISNLASPVGIAVSGSDLFVVSGNFGSVGEYSTSGAVMNASLIPNAEAQGIAVSGSDLYLAIPGFEGPRIAEYTTSGLAVAALQVSGAQLRFPDDLAVAGGNLYVSNDGNGGGVGEFDATTGATINATLIGSVPYGIAVVPAPEPSAGPLLLSSLGLLALVRSRPTLSPKEVLGSRLSDLN